MLRPAHTCTVRDVPQTPAGLKSPAAMQLEGVEPTIAGELAKAFPTTSHYNTDCCGLPCPDSDEGHMLVSAGHAEQVAKVQAFFTQLALEAARPAYGPKDFVKGLLLRAEEAGLYKP